MESGCDVVRKPYFEHAVNRLCLIIEKNRPVNIELSEYMLRRELVACILGSQVRFEMAMTALTNLENAGLLDDTWWDYEDKKFETKIFEVLSGQTSKGHKKWSYRFPKVRARQITNTRNAIGARGLREWLFGASDSRDIRQQLVSNFSGLGPKQASMYLRNIGKSNDLAILDTNVIRFMNMKRLIEPNHINISTLPSYERVEAIFIDFANTLGYPAGCLDLAVWATMRAAKELGL